MSTTIDVGREVKTLSDERYLTVRAARISANLTQEQARKRLGITRYMLQNYETGRSPLPLHVAWLMKDAYGLPSITVLKP